jgi:prophage regulatory protein
MRRRTVAFMAKELSDFSSDETVLLRESELRNRIKLSHSTIWRLVRDGNFPRPIQLSERAKGWRVSDIEAWLAARAEAADSR